MRLFVCTQTDIAVVTFVKYCLATTAWMLESVPTIPDWKVYMAALIPLENVDLLGGVTFSVYYDDFKFGDGAAPQQGSYQNMANHMDEMYARLVKGAMVNTSMNVVWTPADEMANSRIDDDNFTAVMWTYLQVDPFCASKLCLSADHHCTNIFM